MKKNILVLCTGNSCRSQMAEGYLRYFAADAADIYSAGTEPHGVNPTAVETMREDGVDISGHTSDHVDTYRDMSFDFVITVCDHAAENCPCFPGTARTFHRNFPDPSKVSGTEEEIRHAFVTVRRSLKEYCAAFVQEYLTD